MSLWIIIMRKTVPAHQLIVIVLTISRAVAEVLVWNTILSRCAHVFIIAA